jgi:outer membrane immunogenic protein
MKKLLLGSAMSIAMVASASAADIYVKAPPPVWSWTGFYFGVEGGGGWGKSDTTGLSYVASTGGSGPFGPGFQNSNNLSGGFGGGTVGFNWQAGQLVFGLEADISGANITGTGDCSSTFGFVFGATRGTSTCNTNLTELATATGRLGLAIDHALLYVKGGGAWAHFNHNEAAQVASP